MEYLRQLSGYMWQKAPVKPAMPAHVTFCAACPITEGKTDIIYIGKSGRQYCCDGCAKKHTDDVESVYNRKTRQIEWRN